MKKDKFDANQNDHLDPMYKNGQSDVEKLMSRHLQTPDSHLSDEDLKAIKITTNGTSPASIAAPERIDTDTDDNESDGSDRIITPLDVLGG